MSGVNVIRAWKDEEYRLGLSEAERARLPENPAGLLEQTEAELERTVGGGLWLITAQAATATLPWPSQACPGLTGSIYDGGDPLFG
jgi:mersacidin/lichenicidin family type 2 lantibiotic